MTKFQAFGMAGVGIAVAIGFVFALSTLANYANDDDAGLDSIQRQDRELSRTQPSSSLFVQQQQQQQQRNTSDGIASDAFGGSEDSAATGLSSIENETAFGGEEAGLMMQQPEEAPPSQSLQPTLTAILATDAVTGEVIGEVVPGMEFETGKPVFIRAHLMNLHGIQISDSIIALGISSNDDGDNNRDEGEGEENTTINGESRNENSSSALTQHLLYEQAASFLGNIGAGENTELELYWNPGQSGEYTLLLFSTTLDERTSAAIDEEQIVPAASIPIKVSEVER